MSEWQPIETAPQDGTGILTYRKMGLMAVTAWLLDKRSVNKEVKAGCWCVTDGMILTNVTHWMQLPEPPK